VEQSTENMKTGVISGTEYTDDTSFYVFGTLPHWWHQFSCFRQSAPLMTPVFMFSVLCSENWCHQWNRVPKTWKLVPSVGQSTENIKIGVISGVEYRKHRYSAPLMTPVFMFSVLCSTDDTSFHVFCTLLHWWHQFSCENWCHQWNRVPKTWKLVSSVEQST
jgi:hypothetical protein